MSASSESAARLLESLREAIAERGQPLHPDIAPVLDGLVDPTARSSTNRHGEEITAELRSVESALGYYTMEGLVIMLTPLAMMAQAFQLLQILSGDHGDLPDGISREELDPWKEIVSFQDTVIPGPENGDAPITLAEECRRALWHLGRAYEAVTDR